MCFFVSRTLIYFDIHFDDGRGWSPTLQMGEELLDKSAHKSIRSLVLFEESIYNSVLYVLL